jgi:lipoprotein-anchoring transpeptidase ErfK/SrfK
MTQVRRFGILRGHRVAAAVGSTVVLVAACTGGGPAGGGRPTTPLAKIAVQPAANAANIAVTTPVVVSVTGGRLTAVTLADAGGHKVAGALSAGASRWTSRGALGFKATYTVTAHARNAAGAVTDQTSKFSTIVPRDLAYDAMAPLTGSTVGVGLPIRIYFHHDSDDSPLVVTNKSEVLKHITVRTVPAQRVGYLWFGNSTELHLRPRSYWKAGTEVTVRLDLFAVQLADGVFGKRGRDVSFSIGAKHVSIADTTTHRLLVYDSGDLVQSFPASMGKEVAGRYTHNGVHVVTEKKAVQHMDSTTFGLALDAGGYTADVQWATRISNNGEFVHSAPWSVDQQGYANVSHGCVNLAPDRAKWFFDFSQPGDVVEIINSIGPTLSAADGDIYDWSIPWDQWVN